MFPITGKQRTALICLSPGAEIMERYTHTDLCGFAARLLEEAGLSPDRAGAAAEILVEGDLLGHTTHGLQLLAPYLRAICEW
jgi:LDH2 family malate/lactate/ureidoglycolate dehydrogenase